MPVIEAAYYSFYNWNGYGAQTKLIGLDNYARVLHDPIFYQSLLNNVWVVLVSAFVQAMLALWLALLISDKSRSSGFFAELPKELFEAAFVDGCSWRRSTSLPD
ncbi:MAG TPA: hypothetical protein VE860_10510 [Chthoniobacterales bacterium]|nr:hypothetical protein [Chthoniobacterales bacterium]